MGLDYVESVLTSSLYEKDYPETTHVKIRYKDHEYTIPEMCERMVELEDLLKEKEKTK